MFKFYKIISVDTIDKLIGEQPTIKLSSVFNLNDPYEFKFNLNVEPLSLKHKELFLKSNPDSNTVDFKNWQDDAIENDDNWYMEQQLRNHLAQSITLCSFSEENSNSIMWSHYSNDHSGICVEYKPELLEFLEKLKGYFAFGKVNYTDKPPTLNVFDEINSIIKKTMYNKQSEWKYENELRIVFLDPKNDTKFIPIEREYIKSVYIGSRADSEIEGKVIALCKNTNIDIYYAVTLGKSYKVSFEKYKESTIFSRAFWR